MKASNMSIEERRKLLDSLGGKFYAVVWIKGDGSERACVARHMQHDMFTEGHASLAYENPVAHKPEMYTAVDTDNQKWVNINLNNLKSVKCGGKEWKF